MAGSVPDVKGRAPGLPESRGAILKKLFFSTLYLSAFTFGGGYVIITLMKEKFVDELHWLDEDEMLDLVAIAQSSPGPIAVNGAIVLAYKLAGVPGILCSVVGAVLPPFVILTAVSFFYNAFRSNFVIQSLLSGMKAGVSAVIISVVLDMAGGIARSRDIILIGTMIAAFAANYFLGVNVICIILTAAGIGAARTILRERKKKKEETDGGERK
ncbi:chromate transporter [Lachnoclostridium sp. Marseille-P6806]|uniref:chromate transporter n=1 Tax=Lachnoclostridium sp. Marseille-P6806 TaxID=2364793 RepID=UPI00102F91B9|nr:chromate transporter [Lachnoclostridium sp. Marseille-P6806]